MEVYDGRMQRSKGQKQYIKYDFDNQSLLKHISGVSRGHPFQ